MDKPQMQLEGNNKASFRVSLKRGAIYFLCLLMVFAVLAFVYLIARPDPYLENLRTQYVDDNPSEEDKTKFTPLQYNVDRIALEEALDVFLNPNLTSLERKQLAPIIISRIRFLQIMGNWGTTPLEARQRIVHKIEKAIEMGIYEVAK